MTVQGAFDLAVMRAIKTGVEWCVIHDTTIFDMENKNAYHICRLADFERETFYHCSTLVKVVE